MLCQTLVLALLFSLSILMHILSCSLYENWLPLTMGIAYLVAPAPLCCYFRNRGDGLFDSGSKALMHWGEFLCAAITSVVVGVPFVMWHTRVIELGAALLGLSGFILATTALMLGIFFAKVGDGAEWG
ncbi:hypothetical protein AB1Y20_014639 [Prymnesium parvum]|uniref:Vacuolar protein sorting 55 n=1 Tax=Prymnesium parvum TaxID=97485 RepID=A0AB34IDF6_PRYPA